MIAFIILFLPLLALISLGDGKSIDDCPGYRASNVQQTETGLTADLTLAGDPCDVYGRDIDRLRLRVEYQTDKRLHVLITDAAEEVYQVPESVFPRPRINPASNTEDAELRFAFTQDPFTFAIIRKSNNSTLFSSSGSTLIFESQYLRIRTPLPESPNIYGLGEHSDSLRLNTRTLWNRDAYMIPPGTNLYGSHPAYFDHRGEDGTHGVFLLNSNGMDVVLDHDNNTKGQYLECNILGGVLDFYFLSGPTPKDVSVQYAAVAGLPAMVPYWGLGFHQCRYGYRDVYEVAEVVQNYSLANIPLETMWTDIDYMDRRRVFTLDQARFPIEKVRRLVDYLHEHGQQYIVMVDPAVAYSEQEEEHDPAVVRGLEMDVFLRRDGGEIYQGAVWPGPTVFPDWFHPNISVYWLNEFAIFFDPDEGVDFDALWIDMNDAANFCDWPCEDPVAFSEQGNLPPDPPPVREDPGTVKWLSESNSERKRKRGVRGEYKRQEGESAGGGEGGKKLGLPNRDLIDPPYKINNAAGSLSNKTIDTDIVHANGLVEYDTQNLYGTMMSSLSREAMLSRRPTKRPLVITRSTFAGAGAHVAHWLGDNASTWHHYLTSLRQMITFSSILQMPMVGSDACGFTGNTTEQLCSRWGQTSRIQPMGERCGVCEEGIELRYRLLDYLYTGLYRQSVTGQPFLMPVFFRYPTDTRAVGVDKQFFYGDALLISRVTEEDSTSVRAYFPDDLLDDWVTGLPVQGHGEEIQLTGISYTNIPVHIRGGSIIPLRSASANTTSELRQKGFRILIAPDKDGKAEGRLYVDDGESLVQEGVLDISFQYEDGRVNLDGVFTLDTEVRVESVVVLGDAGGEWEVSVRLQEGAFELF